MSNKQLCVHLGVGFLIHCSSRVISNVVSRISVSRCFFFAAWPCLSCLRLQCHAVTQPRSRQRCPGPCFAVISVVFRRHTGQLTAEEFCLSLPQTTAQCYDDDLFCCFLWQRVRTSVLWKNMATNEDGHRQVPTQKSSSCPICAKDMLAVVFPVQCLTGEATLIKITVDLTSRTTGRIFTRDGGPGRNTQLEQATGTQREGVLERQRWQDGAHDGRRERREEVTCHTAGIQVRRLSVGKHTLPRTCAQLATHGNDPTHPVLCSIL